MRRQIHIIIALMWALGFIAGAATFFVLSW